LRCSGVVLASASALSWLAYEWLASRRELAQLGGTLAEAQAEATQWRDEARQALNGLSAAIDKQFIDWRLTPAEKEIGMLLLKGLALKEVANVRGTSERTVRHQAQEIYRKAGLTGRADFAAYFLEDLLVPTRPAATAAPAQTLQELRV
jgi:DNA-binding NarL/FixJ family response regulator